jgi:hypothetical protein
MTVVAPGKQFFSTCNNECNRLNNTWQIVSCKYFHLFFSHENPSHSKIMNCLWTKENVDGEPIAYIPAFHVQWHRGVYFVMGIFWGSCYLYGCGKAYRTLGNGSWLSGSRFPTIYLDDSLPSSQILNGISKPSFSGHISLWVVVCWYWSCVWYSCHLRK